MKIKHAKCPKCGYMTEFAIEITDTYTECTNIRCKAKYNYIMKFNGIYGYNVKLLSEYIPRESNIDIAVSELEG